jgi:exopolysaccharide biosynthesis protein
MREFLKKPYRWAFLFSILMILSFSYVMLDTFVLPKSYQAVVTKAATQSDTASDASGTTTTEETTTTADNASDTGTASDAGTSTSETDTSAQSTAEADTTADTTSTSSTEPVITDTSYEDDNIKITIETLREYDSNVYVADIQLSDASYLQTALAEGTYGRNIKETTSDIAEENNAILAINGDYYGFRNYGYVVRNGVLYRDTSGENEDLVIDNNGDFSIINEAETSLDSLDLSSIWQILSFGPALLEDGQIVVDSNDEVGRAKTSNPRTAIGQVSENHYIIVVSDGRTDESAGLSLLQLAQVFADYGCTTAYNLDGGGSSTMVFNGEVVNVPTDGNGVGEREVSDIVYIGY